MVGVRLSLVFRVVDCVDAGGAQHREGDDRHFLQIQIEQAAPGTLVFALAMLAGMAAARHVSGTGLARPATG